MQNDPVGINVIAHRIQIGCIRNQTLRKLFSPTVSFCMDFIIIFIDIYFGESDKLFFFVVFMFILGFVWLFILLSFHFVRVFVCVWL